MDIDELIEQNRSLRKRIDELERTTIGSVDAALLALVEHAPGFMSVITPEGRIIATGRTSEGFGSVVGRSVYEFVDADGAEIMREAYAKVCATRQPTTYEIVGYSMSGESDHTYVSRIFPILEGNTVKALVLAATDITDRVRLQRSLEESERTMRMTLSATRMGLWRWDAVKDEVTWDARMLEIFGVPNGPRTAAAYLELVHPDDRARVSNAIERALDGGAYPGFEHRVVGFDGAPERYVMTVGTVMRDAAGRSAGFVGGVLDVTEQKRMALQLQRAERVEALGQLTAGIAHNFNNLLAAILPNIELTLPKVPPERRNNLTVALEASLQARELIKDLLTFASRKSSHTRGGSDARDVVSRIESICRATFPREIEIVSAVDSRVSMVEMPATDLEQVLLNLLFNARDAVLESEHRPKRIEVRVDTVSQPGQPDHVRFRVIDTGAGMPEDVRARVFEPFFTTKPAHRGSGLGLANALARVSEAQGTLHCQTGVGAGTTFTLVLPTMLKPRVSASPDDRPPAHAGRGELVLIVDDEPLVRSVTAALLRDQGYETLEAGSAAEARRSLDEHGAAVRLIVLDVSMPRESGVQALPTLRARTDAPIIMFTGLATNVPEGADAVLSKPCRGDELYALVQTMLGKTRS